MESEGIEARMILEIMGRPAEHITKTMEMVLNQLGKEKGVIVKEKKLHKPVPVEQAKDLFTTFAEVDVEFASLETYMTMMFAYMPSNVEIVSPQNFKLTNEKVSSLGNLVISRLHFYDSVAKKLVSEKEILTNQLKYAMEQNPSLNKTFEVSKEAKKPNKKSKKKTGKSKK